MFLRYVGPQLEPAVLGDGEEGLAGIDVIAFIDIDFFYVAGEPGFDSDSRFSCTAFVWFVGSLRIDIGKFSLLIFFSGYCS